MPIEHWLGCPQKCQWHKSWRFEEEVGVMRKCWRRRWGLWEMLWLLEHLAVLITLSQIPLLRWGLVPCIVAKHAMSAGEEAFVWYGYDLDFCPDWWAEYSRLEVDLFMISPPGTWMLGSSKPSLFLTPCGRSMDWVDKTSLGMTDDKNIKYLTAWTSTLARG